MFDLFKDIERYRGVPPYASEHYGVYQPLLGWESKLTKQWIRRGGILVDPRIKRVLDGRIIPGVKEVLNPVPVEFIPMPLEPGSGKSPYRVLLAKEFNSEVVNIVRGWVQTFVDNHEGRLPEGDEWRTLIDINVFMDPDHGPLKAANDIHKVRMQDKLQADAAGQPVTEAMMAAVKKIHLEMMQYESQMAAFLIFHAEAQPGFDPNELKKLFTVLVAPPLSDILRPTDPLAEIDPRDNSGALSPVGFVHLFRQYFFDLGTFLGEPVEHIWLAPGTTIELIEVSTRKTIIERSEEMAQEESSRAETFSGVKDELSDAVKAENDSSMKLGVSTTHSVNFGVYQGSATASFGMDSSRREARETTHKQTREQTEKLSSEIKRSFKSVFKTVTETTDTRSRRYVLQNPGLTLVNYELRRKMRRVGVQLQDLGTRLCWQVFIDDAGATLGLSELVHFAESPDLANLKEPEPLPPPANVAKKVVLPIPFSPILHYDDNNGLYEYRYLEGPGTPYSGKHLGNRSNTTDEDAEDNQIIMGPFRYKFDPPQANYKLTNDFRILGPQGNKQAVVRGAPTLNPDGSFDLIMQQLHFHGENIIHLEVELVFKPEQAALDDHAAARKKAQEKYESEKQRLLKKSYMESVRERINDAHSIKSRPSWDLREEERTVIYRKLIERLMLDSWDLARKNAKDQNNARLAHVRSEVIRAIFDVDSMLYFVAPEWWMPRRHQSKLATNVSVGSPTIGLTDNDLVKWGDVEAREDNYLITEDSKPAKLGSSLGWLMQLDGDNLRNAFLNAPWVKAVIPIRPGRERAALNWLRALEGHDKDGWETEYLGTEPEFAGKKIGEVLETIAERMEASNGKIEQVLEADRVFEKGFDHLAGGFDAGLPANEVFSQWISVLPTDQIVAVDYTPTNLLEP